MNQILFPVVKLEESEVSDNCGVGLSWKVGPHGLVAGRHDHLFNCLRDDEILDDCGHSEDED